MSTDITTLIEMLSLKDDTARYSAFQEMLSLTENKVDWFDQYKKVFIEKLSDENSYQRSIGAMLLCNLAKNDKNQEFKSILNVLMPLINDEKFITQRQYLQNIWKVAIVDKEYKYIIVKQLEKEFKECTLKKHYNLLRLDIFSSMIQIMKYDDSTSIRNIIGEMINYETDEKSKKNYLKILK
jgi:hypothetical protein